MSLVGNLEDLGLGDILQIVSLSRKSGVLNLSWAGVEGRIIFRHGQVVAAYSTDSRRSLPSILVEKGRISWDREEEMTSALAALPDAASVKEALVKEFGLPAQTVDETVGGWIEKNVFYFFTWPEGTFSFELQEIDADIAGLVWPEKAFIHEVGLSPQYLAMEGTRLQDEMKRQTAEAPVGPPVSPPPPGQERPRPREESAPAAAPLLAPREELLEITSEESAGSPAEADFGSVSDALTYYESRPKPPTAEPAAPAPAEEMTEARTEPRTAAAPPAPKPEPQTKLVLPRPVLVMPEPEVMVVDDESIVADALIHHLQARHYQVMAFSDSRTALRHLQEQVDVGSRPAAALYDLIMPDTTGTTTLGGLDLLEKTRKINPAIPIYIMSDYENLPAREKAAKLGARFFFMKPKTSQINPEFDSPELINFIQILEAALQSEPKVAPPPLQPTEEQLINLGEELRREFGEEVVSPGVETAIPSRGLQMLKIMINELNDPASSGQITLLILRFAAELMNRAVIFLVAKKQLAGLGQFGINLDGTDAHKHVRQIRIPLNAPSIFREAIQKRMPIKKPLKETRWNQYLIQSLGGKMPREVFVAPIIAGGKIPAVLYGDNAPDDREIGDTESLEIFLAQAGLAMEKALLERRLREMGSLPESPGAS